MRDLGTLLKCWNPLCRRKVIQGITYCCSACALAYERGYEIHEDGALGHSQLCGERVAERGEFSHFEADLFRQAGSP